MFCVIRSSLVSFIVIVLTACGGSSSSTSPNLPDPDISSPTPSEVILNASQHTETALKQAAESLISTRYSGLTSPAEMDVRLAQQAYQFLFNDSIFEIPNTANERVSDLADENGNVDVSIQCYYQGTVSYSGKLDSDSKGHLSLVYDNCEQSENGFGISGSVAIIINELSDVSLDLSYYYDNLYWAIDEKQASLTGFSSLKLSTNNIGQVKTNNELNILFEIENSQQLHFNGQISINQQVYNSPLDITGELYIGDEGKISISMDEVFDFPPYLHSGKVNMEGNKRVSFDFDYLPYIRYVEDSNGDHVYDVGTYFSSLNDLLTVDASNKSLISLEGLSLPPYAGRPSQQYHSTFDTTTPIEIEPGSYSDPDTPDEQLQISYRWYVNGNIVEHQYSNVLPAYIAVYGDVLQVSMLVSDGGSSIESEKLSITLLDSPATIEAVNFPDIIRSGDNVQFSIQVIDPDYGATDIAATLISGPEGLVFEEGNLVTWNVASDFLFPIQSYDLVFGIPNEDGSISSQVDFKVEVQSNKTFPITRSGINVPLSNKSMSVGDFDGDGENEVLSTDSNNTVFLLEYYQGKYRQKWVYPFKFPSDGRILQVLSANVDQDDSLEIIVVTEKGMSLISDLESMATLVMSIDEHISFAAIKDLDQDDVMEIAFLYSDDSYGSDKQLNVVSFNTPNISIFSTNVSDAVQIEFGNVDNDSNLELVLNNGLVYDTQTWENQWFNGTTFGNRSVTIGDYNGDGIDEIAGANTWGNLAVYNAISKSQLDSFDNFNTCTLHSADVDNDGNDELLVGDCQWGAISTYKLNDNELSQLWSVDMQGHGSVSLASGDSDNDGLMELHWGTGISSSGEDKFITADVGEEGLVIKEAAITSQLDSYSSAGWSHLLNNEEHAVFFIPSTRSGYGGSKIVTFDESGNVDASEEISSNWDNSRFAVTSDFNNDGLGDIFLPSTNLYDGAFAAMQLVDNTIHWQTAGDYSSNIGLIKAIDFNGDGYDDAIYDDGRVLNAIDVFDQTIIANYTFNSNINDFVALRVDSTPTVVVSSGSKLHYLKVNGGVFSESSFIEHSCSMLELFNYDEDEELEVICLQGEGSYSTQEFVIYEFVDGSLTEVAREELTQRVIDIAVDPATSEKQNLYLTIQHGNSNSYWDNNNKYHVQKTTSLGKSIWTGPALVGQPTEHGLKTRKTGSNTVELMLSTNQIMYWIR